MFNQILRPVTRNIVRRGTRASSHEAYQPPPGYRQMTLNDCPVPQGSWQAHYDAKQRKYNVHLLIGVSSLVGSILVAKWSGLIFLNYAPPPRKQQ